MDINNISKVVEQLKLGLEVKQLEKTSEKKSARSEREEIVGLFCLKLTPHWKGKRKLNSRFVGMRLNHLKLPDLYFLKSLCEDIERRGGSYSACFWGSIKPKI